MKTEKRLFSFRQIQSMCRERRMAWGYEDYCFTIPHTRKTKCESKNCPKWKRATRVSREQEKKVSTTQKGWEAMKRECAGGRDASEFKDGDHLIAVVDGEGGRRMTVEEREGELWAVPVLDDGNLEETPLQEWIARTFRGVKHDEKKGGEI